MDEVHFEPFVHLAGLDDDQALIAWGGFWFTPFRDGSGWRIIDDEELSRVDPGRNESIGARSTPYGDALVEVLSQDGRVVASAGTDTTNHVWIRGLESATHYRYRITVDGKPWLPPTLRAWHRLDGQRGELREADRHYDPSFVTFPAPHEPAQLHAAVLGDYGVGIQSLDESGGVQQRIARAIERLADRTGPGAGLDLIVTVGDNIYHLETESVGGSGKEDDDWYFSFYEPYRFVIDHVPLYPAVGNHDSSETEHSDDRGQLDDNHFLDLRFAEEVEVGRASVDPGLFYRFAFGANVEFVCIDTSKTPERETARFFTSPGHQAFLDETFAADRQRPGHAWLIPFGHHPAYCAGPAHDNDEDLIAHMLPRYRRAGVRLALAGHEHNFQHAVVDDVHHLVTGAGGKLRTERPDRFAAAHTRAWAAEPHFLLLRVDAEEAILWPLADVAADGRPIPVDARTPSGDPAELPIVIRRQP